MIIVYAALEIISEYSGARGNIAHLAHLGGFLGGYVFLKFACGKYINWDPLAFLTATDGARSGQTPPRGWRFVRPDDKKGESSSGYDPRRPESSSSKSFSNESYREEPVSRQEIDRLLDKIARSGINSLSAGELATLRRAREQMKK